jgi:hypothetical protein
VLAAPCIRTLATGDKLQQMTLNVLKMTLLSICRTMRLILEMRRENPWRLLIGTKKESKWQ